MFAAVADYGGANLAAAFQNADDCSFVFSASFSNSALALVSVHKSCSTANESFVYFDFAIGTAHLDEGAILHRKPDAMKHEPCGLLCDAESASDFIRTDSVLAVGNHPNGDEPLVERDWGIFEDGADLDGELAVVVDALALPLALILEEYRILASTSRAGHNAIGPAQLDHEIEAIIGVREVENGLL